MPEKMPVNTRSKALSFNLRLISAAVASALLFSNAAYAAGLGKLTVLSSLGQPLHAEIELTSVSKEESGSLAVKLASVEAFRQANIDFNPALFSLRFAIEQRGNRQVVRVTSAQPMNEPFVDMLLELGGTNNRLVREYTFLLDPADLRKAQPAQFAAAAPIAPVAPAPAMTARPIQQVPGQPITRAERVTTERSVPAPRAESEPVQPRRIRPAAAPAAEAPTSARSDSYQIKNGDTLAKIAGQFKPENISLDQMLIALQRANPDAFIGENINLLRAGRVLSIPTAESAGSVTKAEARNLVVAQAADFNGYRGKLASQAANSAPQVSDGAKQSATGKITAKVEEAASPSSEPQDKLKLSKSGAPGVAGADKAAGAAQNAADKIASDKALAEANARVAELEKNIGDLQKLLEIKNKDLASLQKQAANAVPPAGLAAGAGTQASKSPEQNTVPGAAPTTSAPAIPATPATAVTPPVADVSQPAAVGAARPAVDDASNAASPQEPGAEAVQPAEPQAVTPVPAPADKKPVIAAPPPPLPEPSFVDELLDNPMLLGFGALLLAALGGLGIYSSRRKKQMRDFQDSSLMTESGLKANSLFASTGGQSVDTNNSVFNSNFAPSASQLDTNEVDPVAEADVYIAYGRDAQAEEILKEALRTQPERNAVRVKLLEIYANRKDPRLFESMASELYSLTKGKGDDWAQAAALGLALDPNNPLYASAKSVDGASIAKEPLAVPTEQLDELDLAALLNTTRGVPQSENPNTIAPTAFQGSQDTATTDATLSTPSFDDMKFESVHQADQPRDPQAEYEIEAAAEVPKLQDLSEPLAHQPSDEPSDKMDFDFDLDGLGIKEMELPPSGETAKAADTNTDAGLDFDFPDVGQMRVDLHEADVSNGDDERPHADDDFAPLEIDIPDGEASNNYAERTVPPVSPVEFDLSGITLDLHPEGEPVFASSEPDAAEQHHSNVTEMATKLDLALAYQEIGDKEGARELLDEVIKGGVGEQVDKAKSMMQKLA